MNITTDAIIKNLTRSCQQEIHKGYKAEIMELKNKLKIVEKERKIAEKMNANLVKKLNKLDIEQTKETGLNVWLGPILLILPLIFFVIF